MALVNQIIIDIMMAFMVLGALDRILMQFGGSESVFKKMRLGRLGRAFDGAGAQFEEGFNAILGQTLPRKGMD